jgi:hypothetical protein
MATLEEVTQLRRLTTYTETDPYDDPDLSAMIDVLGLNKAAARLWNEQAASLAKLVNTSESGSSRSLGDAHKNALAMAKYFKGLADEAASETPVDVTQYARTRAIVREG